jgi:hypothetical protein
MAALPSAATVAHPNATGNVTKENNRFLTVATLLATSGSQARMGEIKREADMGYLGLFLSFLILIAFGTAFRGETGVIMPTRSALRGIRRRARKSGKSEAQAFEENIARKQRKLFDPPKTRSRKSKSPF